MGEIPLLSADRRGHPPPAPNLIEAPAPAGAKPRPARIVVIGEFNSGKTSLVNALLGAAVLPASFTTHTAYPTVVGFAAKPWLRAEVAGRRRVTVAWNAIDGAPAGHIRRLYVGMPLDRLRTLRATDTPGFGLGDEDGEARALMACRGADAVIWCTPAVQAWKASELRTWLALPRAVRRRGVLAVTFLSLNLRHYGRALAEAQTWGSGGPAGGQALAHEAFEGGTATQRSR